MNSKTVSSRESQKNLFFFFLFSYYKESQNSLFIGSREENGRRIIKFQRFHG